MPIIQEGNIKTLRIKNGSVEIWRVYRGNELVWGLYKLIYHLAGGKQSENPPTEYVWGVTDIDLPTPTWLNQTYYTKFNGWYEGDTYVTAIPAITKDLHKDLELYAKWTQRKYTYSGTYVYQVWVEDGGGGGYPDPPALGAGTGAVDSSYYGSANAGQCTWYAHGRTAEMRGNKYAAAPQGNGVDNAGGYSNAWYWANSGGPYGSYGGNWSRTTNWADVRVGDVVVFGTQSPGHVAVIESKSGNSATLSAYNNPGAGYSEQSLGLLSWTPYENFTGPSYTWGDTSGKFSAFLINHTNSVLGGGGGHYENRYGSVSERDNPSQKPPTDPAPPQGRWSSLNKLTKTRDYNYKTNNWGPWNSGSSGWDTSGEGWL